MNNTCITIKKTSEEKKQVFGEVYAPDIPDAHGDYMTAEEIEKMAYNFMKNMRLDQIDLNHNNETTGSYVIESFIARKDDPTYIPGSWVIGVQVTDDKVWEAIKSGEINGFSMEALAYKKESEVEMQCPVVLVGVTEKAEDGHFHKYSVFINDKGEFVGGSTDIEQGHSHLIKTGTLTENKEDHVHKFSYIEAILELDNDKEKD